MTIGTRLLRQRGHLASPGWNRLTQSLIDSGSYLAGGPLVSLVNSNPNTLLPADLQPSLSQLRQTINPTTGVAPKVTNITMLAPAAHLVTLSPRNLNTSPLDFNDNLVSTNYLDLIYSLDNGDQFKIQGFHEYLEIIRDTIDEGQKAGIFRTDIKPIVAAKILYGSVDEMVTNWVLSKEPYPLAPMAGEVLKVFFGGVLVK